MSRKRLGTSLKHLEDRQHETYFRHLTENIFKYLYSLKCTLYFGVLQETFLRRHLVMFARFSNPAAFKCLEYVLLKYLEYLGKIFKDDLLPNGLVNTRKLSNSQVKCSSLLFRNTFELKDLFRSGAAVHSCSVRQLFW